MNYLAHLLLAEANALSRTGNLMGDFCRGLDIQLLAAPIRAGIYRHRAVDRFTDQAAPVRQAIALFSPERRRFAPIAVDVLFDHLLIQHWPLFCSQPLPVFVQQIYADLQASSALMPPQMAATVQLMVQQDWFLQYADLTLIGAALDRIASRLRFANQFSNCLSEIRPQFTRFEQLFLQFMPTLQTYVQQLGPEQAAMTKASPSRISPD